MPVLGGARAAPELRTRGARERRTNARPAPGAPERRRASLGRAARRATRAKRTRAAPERHPNGARARGAAREAREGRRIGAIAEAGRPSDFVAHMSGHPSAHECSFWLVSFRPGPWLQERAFVSRRAVSLSCRFKLQGSSAYNLAASGSTSGGYMRNTSSTLVCTVERRLLPRLSRELPDLLRWVEGGLNCRERHSLNVPTRETPDTAPPPPTPKEAQYKRK